MARLPPTPKRPPRQATPLELRNAIRDEALRLGFDAVGFAAATLAPEARAERLAQLTQFVELGFQGDMGWLGKRTPERVDPATLWPGAKTVVSVAMNYGPTHDPRTLQDEPSRGAISVYAQGRDYHEVMKTKLKALGRFIWDNYRHSIKVFVDTAPLMEKPSAQAAGHGWQGKHTNLVSRKLGSWFFLGAIFTTLDLAADEPHADRCGECRRCLDICPTRAFPAPYELDARRCISYLTIEHKGHIAREFREPMGNRIYGCDDCLAVCPWNKFAHRPREEAFHAREELLAPLLAELVRLDDAAFRAFFSGSPVKRIGRDRFVRNVLIAIGNSNEAALVEEARALLGDASPLVRAMAVWALGRLAPEKVREHAAAALEKEEDEDVRDEWRYWLR